MDYNEIINLTASGLIVIGLIILIVGIIYIPNSLPGNSVILSQDDFNKTLNNYRLNSLGFKLIISGASILIIGIISFLINISFHSFTKIHNIDSNIILHNNQQVPDKIIEDSPINQRNLRLIKQWTGRTPEEIRKIREDFFKAKKH
jgi:preprotein translocase subunit Sss1